MKRWTLYLFALLLGCGAGFLWKRVPRTEPPVAEPLEVQDGQSLITGTIVVVDAWGERFERLDGSARIGVQYRTDEWVARHNDIYSDVRDGRWAAIVPDGSTVRVEEARLSGREVDVTSPVKTITQDTEIDAVGKFDDVVLRVTDVASGQALNDVMLASLRHKRLLRPWQPTRRQIKKYDSSPIQLDSIMREEVAECLVGAPGYGWRRTHLLPNRFEEQVVELAEEATLVSRVSGLPRHVPVVLRLRRPLGHEVERDEPCSLLLELPVDPAEPIITIDGLPETRVQVSIESGRYDHPRRLQLAQVEVDLCPGVVTEVDLACISPQQLPDRVPVTGTLDLPAEWARDARSLEFEMVDPPFDTEGSHASLLLRELDSTGFDVGQLFRGAYDVSLDLRGCTWTRRVHTVKAEPLSVALPEPAELVIHVQGIPEGDEFWGNHLEWWAASAQHRGLFSGMEFFDNPFRLRVPVGAVWLNARCRSGVRSLAGGRLIQVPAAGAEITLDLRGTACLRLVLSDGGTMIPLPIHVDEDHLLSGTCLEAIQVTPLQGEGELTGWSHRDLYVSAPGRYEIRLDPIDGYAPLSPQVVDLIEGEFNGLEIALRRE